MTFAVSYTFLRRYVGEVTPDEVPRENKGLSRRDAESLAAMLKTRDDVRDVKIVAEKEEVKGLQRSGRAGDSVLGD